MQSRRDQQFQANAIYRTTGKADLTPEETWDTDWTAEMRNEFQKQAMAFQQKTMEEHRDAVFHVGVTGTEIFCQTSKQMRASMDAMLTSITLESWLFFEAFASDLWVCAVDNWTPSIAARMLANQRWEKSETKASSAMQISSNAKTHPGSFWRELGMVSFDKLRLIKLFFGTAFGADAEKLFDSVDGGYIHALSAFRNCIAHRAGRIDQKFKDDTQRFPEFDGLNVGEKIVLDGDIVKRLRNTGAQIGIALINHVDGILISGI